MWKAHRKVDYTQFKDPWVRETFEMIDRLAFETDVIVQRFKGTYVWD